MSEHQDAPRFRSALIVEDHPLFSDALSMTLRSVVGIEVVETADKLAKALERCQRGPMPDVVILDLGLPDVNGLDGLIRLKQVVGEVPVVVVSSLDNARIIGAALRAGAAGFVPKHSQRHVFREAFACIADGGIYSPEGFQSGAEAGLPTGPEDAIARLRLLTRQQSLILERICEGKLNKQIAYDLSIAETTVKAHVTAIMRKLGVHSRTQAVLMAREVDFSTLSAKTDTAG